jgi:hypothetical protein
MLSSYFEFCHCSLPCRSQPVLYHRTLTSLELSPVLVHSWIKVEWIWQLQTYLYTWTDPISEYVCSCVCHVDMYVFTIGLFEPSPDHVLIYEWCISFIETIQLYHSVWFFIYGRCNCCMNQFLWDYPVPIHGNLEIMYFCWRMVSHIYSVYESCKQRFLIVTEASCMLDRTLFFSISLEDMLLRSSLHYCAMGNPDSFLIGWLIHVN